MLEQITALRIVKEDREYTLLISPESTLGELFDVICDMKGFVYEEITKNVNLEEEIRANELQAKLKLVEGDDV